MNIKEYQINAARTCADLGSKTNNLFHMNLGIHTEVGELLDIYKKKMAYGKEIDIVHLTEELGDICFYLANKDTFKDVVYLEDQIDLVKLEEDITQEKFDEIGEGIFITWLEHGLFSRVEYWIQIYMTCRIFNIDFEQMLEININKLKARYPEKFTQEAALNRDLDAEREVLENN